MRFAIWERISTKKEESHTWRVSCISFYVFFSYTILIWCCELADLLCWLAGVRQASLLSRAGALLLTFLIVWRIAGVPREERVKPDLWFGLGCLVITGFFAAKSIQPDMSYDTQNYHLLCQIPGFADNLHYHALPGRFQMFGFRLGDRMFYPFRLLLGLRMGTLFNAAAMLLLYRQAAVFLEWFKRSLSGGAGNGKITEGQSAVRRFLRRVKDLLTRPSVLAFFLVCRFDLLQESGSYMVELAALPFFFEMVFLLARGQEEERARREAFVFCMLGGLLFCLKMTNIVYLAPMVLLYLWRIRKSVTPGLFAACLAAGVLPVGIYLVYNGLSTGNPVFPYYNTIFKSPYYFDADFKDMRWGPQNKKELLLWAFYMLRYPEYRLSEIYSDYNRDLAVIYLAVVWTAVMAAAGWLKKRDISCKAEGTMLIILSVSFLAWAETTGHIRYFMAGILLGGLIAACCYLRLLCRGNGLLTAAGLLLAVPFALRTPCGMDAVWKGREWALRNTSGESIRQNLPLIFRDRKLFPDSLKEKIDVIFLTWGDYGSYARLIGEDVPVYNRYSVTNELSAFREEYLEEIEGFMREGKGVYDLFPQGTETLTEYLKWANEAGWYVHDLEYPDTILRGPQSYTAAGLEMADGRENTWYPAPFDGKNETEGLLLQKEGDFYRLEAITGDPDYWRLPYSFQVKVMADDGSSKREAGVIRLGEAEYQKTELLLDLTGLKGQIRLSFESSQEGKQGIVINPVLSRSDPVGH